MITKPRDISKQTGQLASIFVGVLWFWFALLMAFYILFVGYHW